MATTLPRLVVVEDSLAISQLIAKIGEVAGYKVTIARSLKQLRQLIARGAQFDLASVDYALPDANHGEAIALAVEQAIPTIVLTRKTDNETRSRILNFPIVDYIPKESSETFLYLKRVFQAQVSNKQVEVLVVDDSKAARSVIVELLDRRNFQVHVASDGVEALSKLSTFPQIKIVLTDHEMPRMDGITLTHEIRQQFPRDSKIIIGVSGATDSIYSARFIKNGADDFLRKPFCPEEFYCRIAQNMDRLAQIEEIQRLADTDFLSQLPNRHYFFKKIGPGLVKAAQHRQLSAVAIIDIDRFKAINDRYGHEAGDQAIVLLAAQMRTFFQRQLMCRFGGEEFVVVSHAASFDDVEAQFEHFRQHIGDFPFSSQGQSIQLTLSIGLAKAEPDKYNVALVNADKALYRAKSQGRNRVCIED